MTARVDHENQRLCIGTPGLLDSLELVPEPRLEPGPGEVEIEVHAAGLNFQDVLLALGMLPAPGDGQKLGRECAGRSSGAARASVASSPGIASSRRVSPVSVRS
jgi:D-arabinose 1-dehydrogenase-like Zn-dependent alcohol dehydrogenase